MSQHSFLRESKLYIEYGGNKYRIYTSSTISFSQTFAQDSYPVKTLHDQSKMYEDSTITSANPANFSFDVPLTEEKDERYIINLIPQLNSGQLTQFNIYIKTESSVFKIDSAVITAADFDISPNQQFTARLQGEATKLERISPTYSTAGAFVVGYKYKITTVGNTSFTGIGATNNNVDTEFTATGVGSGTGTAEYVIPGSAQSESSTRTPLLVYPVITVDSLDMNNIMSTTVQVQNNIDWTAYKTLQKSLAVTNATNIMRPSDYTVEDKNISGAIRQYQLDNNVAQSDDFSTNSNIVIKAIQVGKPSTDSGYFKFEMNPASFTTRTTIGEVYTQSYDYRSLDQTPSIAYV